jgi:glycosyltransferase involved in cell wall biosynthesis
MKNYSSFKNLIENKWDFVTVCNLFPPQGGGLENAAYQLLHFLSKEKGFDCLAFFSGDADKYFRKDGIDRIQLGTFKLFHGFYPLVGVRYVLKLSKVLRMNPQATIIIYGRHFTGSIVASILCKLHRMDYLYIDTGFEAKVTRSSFLNFFVDVADRTIFSLCYKFAKKHVIVSNTSKQFLRMRYGHRVDSAKVILNGFEEDVIGKYSAWKKEKNVVFASRLVSVKNPDTVAKAYLHLANKYKDWKFYLIGKGECMFNHMKKDELPSNIKFVDALLSQKNFHTLLSKSAIYVNSSLSEGLPLSIVEAASLGCILVMSDIRHNMEVASVADLEKYSFSAKDVDGLINKLEKAMHDSVKYGNRYHQNIAKKTHKVFANNNIFAQYSEILQDLHFMPLTRKTA